MLVGVLGTSTRPVQLFGNVLWLPASREPEGRRAGVLILASCIPVFVFRVCGVPGSAGCRPCAALESVLECVVSLACCRCSVVLFCEPGVPDRVSSSREADSWFAATLLGLPAVRAVFLVAGGLCCG